MATFSVSLRVTKTTWLLGGSSHLVSGNPSCKWINRTYPIYNQGYNLLTKWDEPPSSFLQGGYPRCYGWLRPPIEYRYIYYKSK